MYDSVPAIPFSREVPFGKATPEAALIIDQHERKNEQDHSLWHEV
jgi:hypothetical protein